MRINNNIAAMNTYSRLSSAQGAQAKSLEKLSSGLRINRAGDDAAGLAISEKMRGQISGLNQASRNAQDGISLIQTAEGGLNETHSILQRMRELAVQSSNDTNTESDRLEIQKEVDQLSTEITRIAKDTQFNTKNLLDGEFKATFHIGANKDQKMELSINNMKASDLSINSDIEFEDATRIKVDGVSYVYDADKKGYVDDTEDKNVRFEASEAFADDDALTAANLSAGISVISQTKANDAIETIDNAIKSVSAERSKLGSVQNRLDHTINNLTTTSENLSAAESRVRDVDMAKEMMEFTKNNILNQASTAMLAQANQMPQGVLQLLG